MLEKLYTDIQYDLSWVDWTNPLEVESSYHIIRSCFLEEVGKIGKVGSLLKIEPFDGIFRALETNDISLHEAYLQILKTIDSENEKELAGTHREGQILDSSGKYFDYFSSDLITEDACHEKITEQQYLDKITSTMEKLFSLESLLGFLNINYELITTDLEEASNCLGYALDELTKPLEYNEWVNRIGDYYIVISDSY